MITIRMRVAVMVRRYQWSKIVLAPGGSCIYIYFPLLPSGQSCPLLESYRRLPGLSGRFNGCVPPHQGSRLTSARGCDCSTFARDSGISHMC